MGNRYDCSCQLRNIFLGLLGAPRRTAYSGYNAHPSALEWFEGIFSNHVTMAVGGTILFLSAMLLDLHRSAI